MFMWCLVFLCLNHLVRKCSVQLIYYYLLLCVQLCFDDVPIHKFDLRQNTTNVFSLYCVSLINKKAGVKQFDIVVLLATQAGEPERIACPCACNFQNRVCCNRKKSSFNGIIHTCEIKVLISVCTYVHSSGCDWIVATSENSVVDALNVGVHTYDNADTWLACLMACPFES